MDNLCHSLLGGALGKAGLASRTPLGMTTLIVANNLPDVDVAVFATDTLAMSFRRGWTHGVLAQATLPIALTALVVVCDRVFRRGAAERVKPREVLLLSYIGVLCHVFLDLLNSYGVRLLMPFSERWFYGDALYIVDPIMYVALGAGWLLATRQGVRPARIGLAVATAYIVVMLASNLVARREVRDGLTRAGRPADTRFMVTPVFVNPFRREVVVELGDRYEKGLLWFEPWPHFRPAGYGVDKGFDLLEAQRALQLPRAQAYLRWSRFPFVQVLGHRSRGGGDNSAPPDAGVWLNDYRYSSAGPYGWSALKLQ
jgi:inner membrane protein